MLAGTIVIYDFVWKISDKIFENSLQEFVAFRGDVWQSVWYNTNSNGSLRYSVPERDTLAVIINVDVELFPIEPDYCKLLTTGLISFSFYPLWISHSKVHIWRRKRSENNHDIIFIIEWRYWFFILLVTLGQTSWQNVLWKFW